jgi:cell wall-associated NlpC family hydrolase
LHYLSTNAGTQQNLIELPDGTGKELIWMQTVSGGTVNITAIATPERHTRRSVIRFLYIVCSLLLVIPFAHKAYGKIKPTSGSRKATAAAQKPLVNDSKLQKEMKKYLGTPYELGGTGPDGIDCSGFARAIYKDVYGVNLPHNAASQSKCPPYLLKKVSTEKLKTGDLIFFSSGKKQQRITHVGLYLSGGEFIHASRSKKEVVVSNLFENHWRSKIVTTKRLASIAPWDVEETVQAGSFDFSPGKKNTFRLHYKTRAVPVSKSAPNKYTPLYYRNPSHEMELRYTRPLYGSAWNLNMSAFREQIARGNSPTLYSITPASIGQNAYQGSYTTHYSRGVSMSSDIKPTQWLSIRPSLTYLTYGPGTDAMDLQGRTVGLDVNVLPESSTWTLSTAVQYSNMNTPGTRQLNYTHNRNGVDMSLKYRQQISDRMQITLIGQHLQKTSSGVEDIIGIDKTDERLSFLLNFMY